jgi:hypothetical protein
MLNALIWIVIWIVVIASSSWVLVDARSIGVQKGQIRGIANMGPVGWFFACLLLWIIGFPMYLAKRPEYKRVNGKDSSNTAVSMIGVAAVAAVAISIVLTFTCDIKVSTSVLQDEVAQSIRETWAKEPILANVKIDSFNLVHKSGNQYEGLLDATLSGERKKLVIDVTYDGKQFMWRVRPYW